MIPCSPAHGRRWRPALLAGCCASLLLAAACGGPRLQGPPAPPPPSPASRLLREIGQEASLRHDQRVLVLTDELLDLAPAGPEAEAAVLLAARSALRAGRPDAGERLLARWRAAAGGAAPPDSLLAAEARLAVAIGDTARAIERLGALRDRAPPAAAAAIAARIADLRAGPSRPGERPGAEARPEARARRLGLLCPLSGRYALLGNAFYDGARLAVRHAQAAGRDSVELLVADTAGDPVTAALAARELVAGDGALAIIGGMLSSTTVAAALEADRAGVPLVSPTATNDRIWRLGGAVFQTNLTASLEARLLVGLGTRLLLKRRYALLGPRGAEGSRQLDLLAAEVRRQGGEIVVRESFAPAETDFREPLLAIRRARPEILYVQATVDQMALLGPQIDFYRLGVLLMGPSSWNSSRLWAGSGDVPARTLFPADDLWFPPAWAEAFRADWRPDDLPDEATPLALKAYQATTLVLGALDAGAGAGPAGLAAVLRERLAQDRPEATGPRAYGRAIRVYQDGEIVPFPADLFLATWEPAAVAPAAAFADSSDGGDGGGR